MVRSVLGLTVAVVVGCASHRPDRPPDPPPAVTAAGVRVSLRDARGEIGGAEAGLAAEPLLRRVRAAADAAPTRPAAVDVAVESYRVRVQPPGSVSGGYRPLVNPSVPAAGPQLPSDPLGAAFLLALWPVAELLNLGYHAGRSAYEDARDPPGATVRLRAAVAVTWPDGRRSAAAVTAAGVGDLLGDDERYWGDAIRFAEKSASEEFGGKVAELLRAGPPE